MPVFISTVNIKTTVFTQYSYPWAKPNYASKKLKTILDKGTAPNRVRRQ